MPAAAGCSMRFGGMNQLASALVLAFGDGHYAVFFRFIFSKGESV